MRAFLYLLLFMATVIVVDSFTFKGRYREAAWQGTQKQSQKVREQVKYWLRKF
jgi:hypothetical protein